MAVRYKLVQRRDMRQDAPAGAKRWHAQSILSGNCTVEELYNDIADRSTATAGDIQLIIDGLVQILSRRLQSGQSVQLGSFGTFRPSLCSDGTEKKEDFNASMIRTPRIVFHPGKQLRELRRNIRVERIVEKEPKEGESEDPESV